MALGVLMIFYVVLIGIAAVLQFFLYRNKDKSKNIIFIINMLFGLFLSYLVYSSLPMNYTGQKILAIALGAISVLALALKLKDEKYILISKIMFSVSIVGGLLKLFS